MKQYKVLLIQAEDGKWLRNKVDNKLCVAAQLLNDTELNDWEEIENTDEQNS